MSTACEEKNATGASEEFVNVAAYKFVALDDLQQRRSSLRKLVDRLKMRGTILLSPEGINLFLAATRESVDEFLKTLRQDSLFSDLEVKESVSNHQPFNRMLIKIKDEIIAFGVEGISPIHKSSPKLPAEELRAWLDEGRKVHLLDTRNDYEIEVGTFKNAIPAGIDNFRDFPKAVEQLPPEMRDEPVVMFCTGGIRCEKAGPFMEQAGFNKVYQLDGGILKYFESCGAAHYSGDCFVFDQRVAVDPALQETQHTQCYVCQEVVRPEDQTSPHYVAGKSCPRCFREPEEQMQGRIAERNIQISSLVTPLPGSEPYFNKRPLNVPQRFDGKPLLDFLAEWHPQVDREEWLRKIQAEEIVPGERYGRRKRKRKSEPEQTPLSPDRIVRGGERFENLQPGTVEPNVNADLRVFFEDDQFIVVDKPAPLPLHASGRFNRNTLQYIIQQAFFPEHPLLVHRLDANTSGVLVLCRKKNVARVVQPQFEDRTVQKTYLARVHGAPLQDKFQCTARISSGPSRNGLRLIDESSGLSALTDFETLSRMPDGTSLLRVTPKTGRTNQIRLHLWHLRLPILGDPAYLPNGETGTNRTLSIDEPTMCLHASDISLHDINGELKTFSAPNPPWAEC